MNNNCVITSPTAFAGLLQIISFKAELLNLSEGTAGASLTTLVTMLLTIVS